MIRLLVLGLIHLFLFNPAYGTLLIPDQEIVAVLDATAQRPGYQKPMPNWVAKEFKEVVSQSVAAGKVVTRWKGRIPDNFYTPSITQTLEALSKRNNLGLTDEGIAAFINSPAAKGLTWDSPEAVVASLKRASDRNIPGLKMGHKKFPVNGDSWVLKQAKQYQSEVTEFGGKAGDANLSFELNGVSFDGLDDAGILIDRKFGQGGIFDADSGYNVVIQYRADSLLEQAERQLRAVGGDGSRLRWEISTVDGASGIKALFGNPDNFRRIPGLDKITIVKVDQITVIR